LQFNKLITNKNNKIQVLGIINLLLINRKNILSFENNQDLNIKIINNIQLVLEVMKVKLLFQS